jgi:chromatin remodeling complex protein RSC6
MKKNVSDYIAKNKLFSKTERLVVLLDPVLKELLNTTENKMELKELVKLYS